MVIPALQNAASLAPDRAALFALPVRLLLMGRAAIALPLSGAQLIATRECTHSRIINRLRTLPPSLRILSLTAMFMIPLVARWQRFAATDTRVKNLL